MTKSISHSAPTPSIREALKHALASLVAAISLLERTPRAKKAAPSDKMFDQMIADYKAAIEQGRAALAAPPQDVMEGIALDAETIQTLLDLLNPLHGSLDEQTYNEKIKENFDAPLWNTFVDAPEPGRKFVALYNDGSGARMFYAFDGGVIDCDGDELYGFDLAEQSYGLWAYLPDNLEFWCETRAEDPMTLKVIR